MTTIQVNLVPNHSETWRRQHRLPELSLLNFLLLASHFLVTTLVFTSIFTMAFLGGTTFFYSWAVFGLDIILVYAAIHRDFDVQIPASQILGFSSP